MRAERSAGWTEEGASGENAVMPGQLEAGSGSPFHTPPSSHPHLFSISDHRIHHIFLSLT